jgi:putative flippase GtrA
MKYLLSKFISPDRKDFNTLIIQFIKFGIVGFSNTCVSFAVYYSLLWLGVHYILAGVVSFIISVFNSYYWNGRHVFKKTGENKAVRIVKVYISYGLTFFISTGLSIIMVEVFGISAWLTPIFNLCVTIPLNFILNKFWAFR